MRPTYPQQQQKNDRNGRARKQRKPPEFDVIKDRLIASMIHRKAQEIAAKLRGDATIEYVDPEIKQQVEREKQPGAEAPKQ